MRILETVENTSAALSVWDFVWWFFALFVFVAYLLVLFAIIRDIFQDSGLNGWLKALWIIFLVFVPFLTALIYLIARGASMSKRSATEAAKVRAAQDAYIKSVAGSGTSPSEEIVRAKALLDAGSISEAEYKAIKAKAIS
ncbi:PLDc N-terminal domain-containing protein [Microbacterium sp. SS28]|uniref:PLDc N-terminal domain-containing protein n=1 Tax=Microbacterium sp. SS28 TaxID=2919948 RepID=UPI001FAAD551|nr:PLDc N-terminal domain-containing protein [Microbacterium sp. SS28]